MVTAVARVVVAGAAVAAAAAAAAAAKTLAARASTVAVAAAVDLVVRWGEVGTMVPSGVFAVAWVLWCGCFRSSTRSRTCRSSLLFSFSLEPANSRLRTLRPILPLANFDSFLWKRSLPKQDSLS